MAVKRLEYGLILVGLLAFHIFFVDYLSFYLLLFFCFLPVLSLVLTLLSGLRVQVRLEAGAEGGSGNYAVKKRELFAVRMYFTGNSRLGGKRIRVRMSVKNELLRTEETKTLAFAMEKKKQLVSFPVSSEYCGNLTCRIRQVKLYDYLWLFAFPIKEAAEICAAVSVKPDIRPYQMNLRDQPAWDWESDEYSAEKPGDDSSELFDIREYREGDRISRIHWKLSSKRDELMMKEGSLPVSSRILLALDLAGTADGGGLADSLVETAASVSWFLMEKGICHRVGWWQEAETGGQFLVRKIEDEEAFHQMLHEILSSGRGAESMNVIAGCLEEEHISRILYFCTGLTEKEAVFLCGEKEAASISIFQMKKTGDTDRISGRGEKGQEPGEAGRAAAESLGAEWRVLKEGRQAEGMKGFEI
ncbi:DUF58 domain-containing protein [Qiania dongpingensis]|uniref:DUF58 domain-containing protein n=1 Tax=Qiania dongpingensis TaxID=2763669 RepID=A0A7G9G0T7_9FIRM|nr:DUF58 domain-containing protein [Qiania dongpingensis]QNM04419.1 DUF58 domain-containing protein [Qiania dongpingensis]